MDSTAFSTVYESFFNKITDDMYMEISKEETENLLSQFLLSALQWVEFPKKDLNNYDLELESFNMSLTREEINIISTYMMVQWFTQQLATVDLTRMDYTGADFKMTSQANHAKTLRTLKLEYEREGFHLQRLYKRRYIDEDGNIKPTMAFLMKPTRDF